MRESEENNGKGNGGGWRINFYDHGWLAGMLLDIDLRLRTNGRLSLDDVERSLWKLCKDDRPGFEEGEIERQYVRLGGSRDYFERVVMKPGELPIEETLARIGFRLEESKNVFVDRGFDLSGTYGFPEVTVDNVRPFAVAAGLMSEDTVMEINGVSITGKSLEETRSKFDAALSKLKAVDSIKLKVRRNNAEREINYLAVEASTPVFKIAEASGTDPKSVELRRAWYSGKQ